MVDILPFRGTRYAPRYAAGSDVYAPPYDVVDARQREALLNSSEYNIIRLTLGPEGDGDWYADAARIKQRWLEAGVLIREGREAFYGYQQHFVAPHGEPLVRSGFIALVPLQPWGREIHRHEHTKERAKRDRLRLMQAMQAQMSPVFGIYDDPHRLAEGVLTPPAEPAVTYRDGDGVIHRFWPIVEGEARRTLQRLLRGHDIVIADGHHRYETALAYRHAQRERNGGAPGPYDYVMMYLTELHDPGLHIIATHRVISDLPGYSSDELLSALRSRFRVEQVPDLDAIESRLAEDAEGHAIFGACLADKGNYLLASHDRPMAQAENPLDGLDVVLLQRLILAPCLGITQEALSTTEWLHYQTDAEQALREVRAGQAQVAFIVRPTSPQQVWQVASRGDTMPPKSTYFTPKLLTGLVFHEMD